MGKSIKEEDHNTERIPDINERKDQKPKPPTQPSQNDVKKPDTNQTPLPQRQDDHSTNK